MITPRRTRLLRAPDLQTFRRIILRELTVEGPATASGGRTVVLVPTSSAATALLEFAESPVTSSCRVLTRDAWYRQMHRDHGGLSDLMSDIEREACMMSCARLAESRFPPPFKLRPGLASAIVTFYDQIRRHRRSVDAFDRLLTEDLELSVDLDRGARRLLRQTRFLVATFREYEQRLQREQRLDEHGVRRDVIEDSTSTLLWRVIVTIPDHVVDPTGLWPADYDLLTRLPGLQRIDVVATDRVLDAGLGERIADLLPEIEDVRSPVSATSLPVLSTPADGDALHFVWRDREEELLAAARRGLRADDTLRVGVVYRRPLPYLYLARQLFTQVGLACHSSDALPLAAEPYAAAVDVVCRFVTSQFDRVATVELLRSPHFSFSVKDGALDAKSVEALDHALSAARFLGGRAPLKALAASWEDEAPPGVSCLEAVRVAVGLAEQLSRLEQPAAPGVHLKALGQFLREHRCRTMPPPDMSERETAARELVWRSIDELTDAYRDMEGEPRPFSEAVAMLRRKIEGHTLHTTDEPSGVRLVDPHAAAYSAFDELFIVGLVDGEWPERSDHNVFYPSSLLSPLGWPRERAVARAARASFIDLLTLPAVQVSVSTIALENDTVVTPSSFLEQLDEAGLVTATSDIDDAACVGRDAVLALSTVDPDDLPSGIRTWFEQRSGDRQAGLPSGRVGPQEPTPYAVSALDVYLDCPFKYFAQRVLRLGEDPVDERTATPRRLGQVLHGVFEAFYASWHDDHGGRLVTIDSLPSALRRFRELTEVAVEALPAADRPVVRAWLLGSAASSGLAERLFALETGIADPLKRRFTELRIDGHFVLNGEHGPRSVHLRGIADRVDLFSDGTFHVVDYKTNRAPDRNRSVQLPLYARCLEAGLSRSGHSEVRAAGASYAAFGEPRIHVPLGRRDFSGDVEAGERRAVDVVERIERGEFPVRPSELFRCNFCAYPTVCRKDYVGDE